MKNLTRKEEDEELGGESSDSDVEHSDADSDADSDDAPPPGAAAEHHRMNSLRAKLAVSRRHPKTCTAGAVRHKLLIMTPDRRNKYFLVASTRVRTMVDCTQVSQKYVLPALLPYYPRIVQARARANRFVEFV